MRFDILTFPAYRIRLVMVLLLSLLAGLAVIYITRWGPWAGSDSVIYISVARSLLSGKGLGIIYPSGRFAPFTLQPPFYSIALAGLGAFGVDMVQAARWMDVLLFALTILAAGLIFLQYSRSPWLAVPVCLFLMVFPIMVNSFSSAMSEPLFLFLTITSLLFIIGYLREKRRSFLLLSSCLSGLAMTTRYIGLAVLPAALVGILAFLPESWKRRWIDTAIYLAIFLAPNLAWHFWNSSVQGVHLSFGLPQNTTFWQSLAPLRVELIKTLWGWAPFSTLLNFSGYNSKLLLFFLLAVPGLILFILTLAGLYGKDFRGLARDSDFQIFAIFTLFDLSYLITFTVSYILRSPPQDVNSRTLLPLYPGFIVALFAGFSMMNRAWAVGRKMVWIKIIPWLILVLGLTAYFPGSYAQASSAHRDGMGYTSRSWQYSETIRAARTLPASWTYISNEAAVILLYTGRTALGIEEIDKSKQVEPFTRYGDNPADPGQVLFSQQKAALILFQAPLYWQMQAIYDERAQERIDALTASLDLYGKYPDGAIYLYPQVR